MYKKHKMKILGIIGSLMFSFAVWSANEYKEYVIFKSSTVSDVCELKAIAKETAETTKRIEIELGKIATKLEERNPGRKSQDIFLGY